MNYLKTHELTVLWIIILAVRSINCYHCCIDCIYVYNIVYFINLYMFIISPEHPKPVYLYVNAMNYIVPLFWEISYDQYFELYQNLCFFEVLKNTIFWDKGFYFRLYVLFGFLFIKNHKTKKSKIGSIDFFCNISTFITSKTACKYLANSRRIGRKTLFREKRLERRDSHV